MTLYRFIGFTRRAGALESALFFALL